MIVFWIIAALLSAAAAAAIMAGAAQGARADAQAVTADPSLALHRRQLAEVDDLAERGLLAEPEREALQAEAARRLLAAADETAPAPAAEPRGRLAVLAVACLTAILALCVYLAVGAPGAPDQPFAKRVAAWRNADPATLTAEQMAAVLDMMAKQSPTDPAPLQALGIVQLAAGQPVAAQTAIRKALALAPDRAALWATLGEAFMAGAQGVVDADAQRAFQEALKRDPANRSALYYLGKAALDAGDKPTGLTYWRTIVNGLVASDPRRARLEAEIAAAQSGPALGDGGPSQAQVAAARGAVGPAQIRAMVDGLAQRLAASPDDADGWVRLVRAYGVLGDKAKQAAALKTANAQFANRPDVLSALKAASR
jgi:cytochrome c-type biogenesis protein CcmH